MFARERLYSRVSTRRVVQVFASAAQKPCARGLRPGVPPIFPNVKSMEISVERKFTTVLGAYKYMEAPRWRDNRVWISDFYTHEVVSANEDGTDPRVEAVVANQPSGLGWLPDGRLLVVSMRDRKLLRREPDGALVTHADLSAHVDYLLNDLVVDSRGRAYVGNFGFDLMGGAPVQSTMIHRVDPDGTVTPVAEDLWFPNGSVITDAGVLLVVETLGNRITAFDILADGGLANRRVWAEFGQRPDDTDVGKVLTALAVASDGCCLDAEGALWVADAAHGRVVRVTEGGHIVDEIQLQTGVFACALGGADGRTLFLCTAPDFFEENRANAREASLLSVPVELPGAGLN
jgi:sugar lactone lactonase YvrE